MKQATLYNELVRCYNHSRRKLQRLATEGKNLRRQDILQRRIVRLFKTLTGLQRTLKLGMATAALSAGMLLFQPNAAHAQIAFAAAQSNPFGLSSFGFYSSPTFVDLDADGDMDMMTSQNDGKLYYSRNVGTASAPAFSGAQINPFGLTGGFHPSFADLDGDGDLDLMAQSTLSGTWYLYYSENTGTASAPAFAAPQINPFGITGTYYADPAFADLDADGDFDLLVGGYEDFYYFQNIGTGSSPAFASLQINPFGLSSVYKSTPTFADVDGDGDMDLMSGSLGQYNNNKYYFQNNGTPAAPAFAAVQINPFGLKVALYSTPVFVDLDNDGDLDFMQGEYSGTFSYHQNTAFCSGVTVYADADGDHYGNPANSNIANDCIVPTGYVTSSGDCNDNNPMIKPGASEILDGVDDNCNGINDDFTFVQVNPFGLSNVPEYSGIDFVDLDGDDDLDLMGGGFLYFENTGTFSTPAFIPPLDNPFGLTGGQLPSFADLDGDGDMDLMAQSGFNLNYFENTGTSAAPAFAPPLTNPFGIIKLSWQNNLEEVVADFADLDADGDLDMMEGITRFYNFYNNNYGWYGSFLYYENVGTPDAPVFAAPLINPFGLFGISYSRPSFADVDNDGDMDLLIVDFYEDLVYFQNTGTASSPVFTKISISGFPLTFVSYGLSFADLDADGDMDVMSENYSLSYYTNNHIFCSGGTTVYADADGDQYGDASNSLFVADCIVPPGYVDDSTDCNDANATIYPKECDADDGIDDNCNGIADDGFGATTYFTDADGDGFGAGTGTSLCSNPGMGYATNNTDCNDADAAVYPGATEVENGIDDNCNGIIDDGNSCLVPANLLVTNITGNSAKLQWDDLATALGYVIKYNTDGGNEKAKVTYTKSNSKPILGLTPNTTYFWRVKSVCSEDPKVTTDWSGKQYFTTAPLKVSNQQATTMELYPNPVADQFTLHLQLPALSNQTAEIFLLNTLGQVLYSAHASAGNGTINQVIAMPATAASGWYVVRVVMSDQVIEQKLLYQK
jgi:hypothetical protein